MCDDRDYGRTGHNGKGTGMSGPTDHIGAEYATKKKPGEMTGSQKPDLDRRKTQRLSGYGVERP